MHGTRDYTALTVIVAARNEEGSIEQVVRRVVAAVPGAEILVVDGGTDSTSAIVERLADELPRVRAYRNRDDRGKGHAIRVGIEQAAGDVHAQIDADLQFLPEELSLLVDPILDDVADVTLGTRFLQGAVRHEGSTPFFRTLGNKFASRYVSELCGQRVTDVQAGMKAWSRRAAERIAVRSDNYSYEAEIVVNALRRGLRVRDVAITTDARRTGVTNVNVVRDGVRLLWDITRFRFGPR
jgi:glycosyltransferase involved in cell wall biosynthesis